MKSFKFLTLVGIILFFAANIQGIALKDENGLILVSRKMSDEEINEYKNSQKCFVWIDNEAQASGRYEMEPTECKEPGYTCISKYRRSNAVIGVCVKTPSEPSQPESATSGTKSEAEKTGPADEPEKKEEVATNESTNEEAKVITSGPIEITDDETKKTEVETNETSGTGQEADKEESPPTEVNCEDFENEGLEECQ